MYLLNTLSLHEVSKQCFHNTVEIRMKEPRFFLFSLARFLVKELVFLIPDFRALVHSTCLTHSSTVFSARTLENSLEHL